MPTRHVCQNFFRDALAPFHKYLQNSLLDATTALIKGTFLMLTALLIKSKVGWSLPNPPGGLS